MNTLEILKQYKEIFKRNEYNNNTAKTMMRNDLYTRDEQSFLVFDLDNNYKKNYNKNIYEFIRTVQSFVLKELGISDRNLQDHVVNRQYVGNKRKRSKNVL